MGLVPVDSMILNSPFSKDSRKIMTKCLLATKQMLVHEWVPRSDCVGTYGAIFVRREVEFSQYIASISIEMRRQGRALNLYYIQRISRTCLFSAPMPYHAMT